jgi:hypothetical protein
VTSLPVTLIPKPYNCLYSLRQSRRLSGRVRRRRCLVVTKNKVHRNGQLGFGLFNERHAPNVGCDLAVRRPFRRMRSSRKLEHRGMLADA